MSNVIIIDNYDSFTYNLLQAVASCKKKPLVRVFRNDAITATELKELNPDYIIISPGPCTPKQAGNSIEIIRYFAGSCPILGVCLGHQCIAEVFGGETIRTDHCMHGKTSQIHHDGKGLFKDLPEPFTAMKYHSLIVDDTNMDNSIEVSARDEMGQIMAIRHRSMPLYGFQFHPESFATTYGTILLERFICGA